MKKNLKFIVFFLVILGAIFLWQYSVIRAKNQAIEQNTAQSAETKDIVKLDQVTQDQSDEPTNFINLTFDFGPQDQLTSTYQIPKNNIKNLTWLNCKIDMRLFFYQKY